jgi:hypothetical protein
VVWVLVQVALPLRHLAYPGDHRRSGEGYRLGWNVLAVERVGSVVFEVRDRRSGRRWSVDPAELYTATQLRAMASEPDLVHQAAIAIAREERRAGLGRLEVRVDAWMSFNGRRAQRWIDPEVDLASQPRTWGPRWWVLTR